MAGRRVLDDFYRRCIQMRSVVCSAIVSLSCVLIGITGGRASLISVAAAKPVAACQDQLSRKWTVKAIPLHDHAPNTKEGEWITFRALGAEWIEVANMSAGYVDKKAAKYPTVWDRRAFRIKPDPNNKFACIAQDYVLGYSDASKPQVHDMVWMVTLNVVIPPDDATSNKGAIEVTMTGTIPTGKWTGTDG